MFNDYLEKYKVQKQTVEGKIKLLQHLEVSVDMFQEDIGKFIKSGISDKISGTPVFYIVTNQSEPTGFNCTLVLKSKQDIYPIIENYLNWSEEEIFLVKQPPIPKSVKEEHYFIMRVLNKKYKLPVFINYHHTQLNLVLHTDMSNFSPNELESFKQFLKIKKSMPVNKQLIQEVKRIIL